MELFISLAQEDGSEQMVNGKPSNFPFGEAISKVLFVVFKLPAGQDRIQKYEKFKQATTLPSPVSKSTVRSL